MARMTRIEKLAAQDAAKRIDAHLHRFEGDPKINQYPKGHSARLEGLHPFWNAWARYNRGKITVQYISYQGATSLTREEASTYLAWLDKGNAGKHYEVLRDA